MHTDASTRASSRPVCDTLGTRTHADEEAGRAGTPHTPWALWAALTRPRPVCRCCQYCRPGAPADLHPQEPKPQHSMRPRHASSLSHTHTRVAIFRAGRRLLPPIIICRSSSLVSARQLRAERTTQRACVEHVWPPSSVAAHDKCEDIDAGRRAELHAHTWTTTPSQNTQPGHVFERDRQR